MPKVRPEAAKTAQLHVVSMGSLAVPKDRDDLVLATIERTHATVTLRPDADVDEAVEELAPYIHYVGDMAPINAVIVQ